VTLFVHVGRSAQVGGKARVKRHQLVGLVAQARRVRQRRDP